MNGDTESAKLYLGVDLGNTKTAISLWSATRQPDGFERLTRSEWATPAGGPEPTLERIAFEADILLRGVPVGDGASRLAAVGISGGGPVDPDAGVLLGMPKQTGWERCPLARRLAGAFGVPARIENDANACAVAEWLYGAGRGARNLVFLTCSTGIGAGLVLDGKLYRGASGLAGEVGLTVVESPGVEWSSGVNGCLEAYASGEGMARRLAAIRRSAADPTIPTSAREVVERARLGDQFSLRFLSETAGYLARGLAPTLVLLDLERVILGTIVASAGDLILEPLRRALRPLVWNEHLERVELLASALWPHVGDYAAFCVARDFPRISVAGPRDPDSRNSLEKRRANPSRSPDPGS